MNAPVEPEGMSWWSDIQLMHCSLPEIDLSEIDTSIRFCNSYFDYPFIISALTGGCEKGGRINEVLAKAAEHFNIGMELGSQRSLLEFPELESTYSIARKAAPNAYLMANIGAPQLIAQSDKKACVIDDIKRIIDVLRADALVIHLNFLQEAVMLDGDSNARGCLDAIGEIARAVDVPVVIKETGAGISRDAALKLKEESVAALDVGGLGGTSMALIESFRAGQHDIRKKERLGRTFAQWGIPAPVSVVGVKSSGLPIIASGGIRTGLDATKALVLGANLVGLARPLLACATEGLETTVEWLDAFFSELRTGMFLSGAASVEDLKNTDVIILGNTREWLNQLGYSRD